MSNLRQYKRTLNLMAMFGLLGVAMSLSAQTPTSSSNAEQITGLMAALSDHSKTPSAVLDPNLSPSDRSKSLAHFSAAHYELSLVPEGAPTVTGDTATVPVRVHFKADNGNSLDAGATAHFVRRNGVWYFSNFDFMSWPAFLIVALVGCVLIGISYAATVLILMRKLLKQGSLGVNGVTMFIPLFWPALFRKARQVPV